MWESAGRAPLPLPDIKVGQQVTGKVTKVEGFGIFVNLKENTKDVLLRVRNLGDSPPGKYAVDQEVTVSPSVPAAMSYSHFA